MARPYDYAVVGGGPCGVALSLLLADAGRSVVLLDEHSELGGCHRVKRARGVNTEHGPKVYMGINRGFFGLCERLSGRPWRELFARYEHTVYSGKVRGPLMRALSTREKASLAWLLVRTCVLGLPMGAETMAGYMGRRGFSARAAREVDGLCRILDGGGAARTLADTFAECFDKGALTGLYVPAAPLDETVWGPGGAVLAAAGVEGRLGWRARALERGAVLSGGGERVWCHRCVLAVPPAAIERIGGAAGELGMREGFAAATRYRRYISATVEFGGELPRLWGHPLHPWSDISLDAGRYAGLGHGRVLMSINDPGAEDPATGLTADSLETRGELEAALKRLAEERYGARARFCVLSPTAAREGGRWAESDEAFLATPEGFMGHGRSEWLFTAGHHAGMSRFLINTCESAVQNAHALAGRLEGAGEAPADPPRVRDLARLVAVAAAAWALAASAAPKKVWRYG